MPKGKKQCPSCDKSHGARKHQCECSHVFGAAAKQESTKGKPKSPSKKKQKPVKQTKHPLGQVYVPATGLWVFDVPNGMPAIHAPDDLPSGPLSNQDIYEETVYNGLGECIQTHIPTRRIADPKLRKLWKKADEALEKVWRYLIDDDTSADTATK